MARMVTGRIRWAILAVAAGTLIGCSTIRDAREAQREVREKSEDNPPSARRAAINLRGRPLAGLVDFAMTNRPSVVSARLAVDDARLALKSIAADAPVLSDTPWTAPNVSLGGGYSESSDGTRLGGGEGFRTHGSASSYLSLELLVYDFGRYGARAKAQAETVLAAERQLLKEGFSVFGEVSTAYFEFTEARSHLGVSLTNRQEYADQLMLAEARFKAGEAEQLDVLRAKVDLAVAEQELVAASNTVDTTAATLMFALGVDVSKGTPAEVLDLNPISLGTVVGVFEDTTYGVPAAYDLASTNAPDMRVARAKLRSAMHSVDYAIADLMPTISLSTSFSWTDPMWYWNWGVTAAQSLFQGFRKVTAVDRAVVAMKQAAIDVDKCEHELSVSIEKAIAVRDNAIKAIVSSMAAVNSARENLDMVRAEYEVGDANRIDLSSALAKHSESIGDLITSYYYGQKAEASLFVLLGEMPKYHERWIVRVDKL